MSLIKNKATIYAVMRGSDKRDVVCCFAKTLDGAETLCGEYEQQWLDSGGEPEDMHYFVVANTFYDK